MQKQGKEVVEVEKNDGWHWRKTFYNWKEVECIIHQGAMSSTTNTNLKQIFTFNIEFSEWLFEQAAKYEIPVKYASSASVYGNEQGIINPLNYYALSKVTTDYWVQDNMDRFPLIQDFVISMSMVMVKIIRAIKQVPLVSLSRKSKRLAN